MSGSDYTPPPVDPTIPDRWRAVTTWEPADFVDGWRRQSERNQRALDHAPVVARGRDLRWAETANEHRVAMLVGRQVGFPTMGTSLSKVQIPAGHHTGRQRHGEEAIHVLEGEGFLILDGRRYDFHAGTTINKFGEVVNAGGRVLGVTAMGDTIADAKRAAYEAVDKISWQGGWCRRDISDKAQ